MLIFFKGAGEDMIDILTDAKDTHKNVKQIGTPLEEEKIYISNEAYNRIHRDEYSEKRAFVLMGHTQRSGGKYATFIEGAIPVYDMVYEQTVPMWSNKVWSKIFYEIKRSYEDKIIVGWALDLKGYRPKITPEFEKIHREQFGGMHQLFYLLDTLEQEENFYVNKGNSLCKKSGFYIYYKNDENKHALKNQDNEGTQVEIIATDDFFKRTSSENIKRPQGRYRDMVRQQNSWYEQSLNKPDTKETSSVTSRMLVLLVAALVVFAGNGIVRGVAKQRENRQSVETMGDVIIPDETESELEVIHVEKSTE